MSRTVLDLDEDLLTEAAEELGTTTKVATVRKALEHFQNLAKRRRAMELLYQADIDLSSENLRGAWR